MVGYCASACFCRVNFFFQLDMKTNPGVQSSEVSEHKEYIHHPHHVVIVDLQPDLSGLLSTSVNSASPQVGSHDEPKTELKKKPQKRYRARGGCRSS